MHWQHKISRLNCKKKSIDIYFCVHFRSKIFKFFSSLRYRVSIRTKADKYNNLMEREMIVYYKVIHICRISVILINTRNNKKSLRLELKDNMTLSTNFLCLC